MSSEVALWQLKLKVRHISI